MEVTEVCVVTVYVVLDEPSPTSQHSSGLLISGTRGALLENDQHITCKHI